jgi:hypothetical protein
MAMDNLKARAHKIRVLLQQKPILESNSKANKIIYRTLCTDLSYKKEVLNIKIQADKNL